MSHSTGSDTNKKHQINLNNNTKTESESESENDRHYPSISNPIDSQLLSDIRLNPLHEVATTAAALGLLFGVASTSVFYSSFKQPSVYIMALSLFHFLEYYVTAKYNSKKVHKESFIINNGPAYTMAHSFALLEVIVEYYLFPSWKKSFLLVQVVGVLLILIGQYIRYIAMKTAGQSFSHLVKAQKEDDHELVTSGIYAIFRHPSYFGFFWWAVGTQLLLLNPIGLVAFCYVLWMFFSQRIAYEEKHLIKFFGDAYVEYRNKTPVYIPFIN